MHTEHAIGGKISNSSIYIESYIIVHPHAIVNNINDISTYDNIKNIALIILIYIVSVPYTEYI